MKELELLKYEEEVEAAQREFNNRKASLDLLLRPANEVKARLDKLFGDRFSYAGYPSYAPSSYYTRLPKGWNNGCHDALKAMGMMEGNGLELDYETLSFEWENASLHADFSFGRYKFRLNIVFADVCTAVTFKQVKEVEVTKYIC